MNINISHEHNICLICNASIPYASRILKCGHEFHESCIEIWEDSNLTSCPVQDCIYHSLTRPVCHAVNIVPNHDDTEENDNSISFGNVCCKINGGIIALFVLISIVFSIIYFTNKKNDTSDNPDTETNSSTYNTSVVTEIPSSTYGTSIVNCNITSIFCNRYLDTKNNSQILPLKMYMLNDLAEETNTIMCKNNRNPFNVFIIVTNINGGISGFNSNFEHARLVYDYINNVVTHSGVKKLHIVNFRLPQMYKNVFDRTFCH